MNLTTLTDPRAVCVQAQFTSRDEAIRQLATRLVALGKIADADTFLAEVFHRESLGPTALGEGLAVPHGKSAAVKEAAFAVATLCEPLAPGRCGRTGGGRADFFARHSSRTSGINAYSGADGTDVPPGG